MNVLQWVLLFLTALGAALAAIFTWFAADATKRASRGATLLACLENYVVIMKDKRKAQEEGFSRLAEEFYRELLDLHWSEFRLWRDNVIPDSVMQSWVRVRKRNFDSDQIICKAEGSKIITYKDCWNKLKSENYFEIDDPFVQFMNKAHPGEIINVVELRRIKKQFRKELKQ